MSNFILLIGASKHLRRDFSLLCVALEGIGLLILHAVVEITDEQYRTRYAIRLKARIATSNLTLANQAAQIILHTSLV